MKRILICPDKSSRVGLGHLKRCHALCASLAKDFDVRLLPLRFSEKLQKFDLAADAIILDTHQPIGDFIEHCNSSGCKTIVLDNFSADRRTLGINIFDHTEVDRSKTITNFDHIILRDEVFSQPFYAEAHENYAVIVFGGEDVLNQSKEAATKLRNTYSRKIILVLGEKAKEVSLGEEVTVLRSPGNFLQLLCAAELVLCNAGTTLFEALYYKRKCITFPQSDFERNISRFFLERNLILGEGINCIKSGLEKLTSFSVGPLPFNGKGATLIAQRIQELL